MALDPIKVPDQETEEEKAARLAKEAEEAAKKEAEEAALKAKEEEERKAKEAEEARRKAEEEARKKELEDASKIIIDDIEYTVDENGNAVDSTGNIKFTKEDIDKMSENNEDPTDDYFESISKASGIVIKDEAGQVKKYEQTIEGFAQREADVKALGEAEGFGKGFTKFMQDNPDIASIIEYKNRYGTIEGYAQHVDYSKVEIKDDNAFLEDLIYKAEIQKGTTPERAKRLVEFAKANNTLKEDATESLNWLKKTQQAEVDAIQAKQKAEYEEAIQKEMQFYGASYDEKGNVVVHNIEGSLYDMIVTKGAIGDYALPKNGLVVKTQKGDKLISREEIYDYFARPVTEVNGYLYTQAQIDEMHRMANPNEMALRYIMNLTGGIDQLVKKSINDAKVKQIRSLKSAGSKTTGSKTKTTDGNGGKVVLPIK